MKYKIGDYVTLSIVDGIWKIISIGPIDYGLGEDILYYKCISAFLTNDFDVMDIMYVDKFDIKSKLTEKELIAYLVLNS